MSSKPTTADALAGKLKRTELQHEHPRFPAGRLCRCSPRSRPASSRAGINIRAKRSGTSSPVGADGDPGQTTLILHAGVGFLMPPRTPHNATDLGPDTGQMLSTYIVEAGQPLAAFTAAG